MYIYTFSHSDYDSGKCHFICAEYPMQAIEILLNHYRQEWNLSDRSVSWHIEDSTLEQKERGIICFYTITIDFVDGEDGEVYYTSEYEFVVKEHALESGKVYSC